MMKKENMFSNFFYRQNGIKPFTFQKYDFSSLIFIHRIGKFQVITLYRRTEYLNVMMTSGVTIYDYFKLWLWYRWAIVKFLIYIWCPVFRSTTFILYLYLCTSSTVLSTEILSGQWLLNDVILFCGVLFITSWTFDLHNTHGEYFSPYWGIIELIWQDVFALIMHLTTKFLFLFWTNCFYWKCYQWRHIIWDMVENFINIKYQRIAFSNFKYDFLLCGFLIIQGVHKVCFEKINDILLFQIIQELSTEKGKY